MSFFRWWIPLILGGMAFLAYLPSLKSDFVYDAHLEIITEGFITSLSNLPDVLTLKVLSMNLMLGSRPGQLLYLILIAAISGTHPFGYHLSSNLLHAVNVGLLFVLLRRLVATEITVQNGSGTLKVQLAVAAVTLIFALHPIAVESVSEVSYSSSLLVTFFTLLALFMATVFRAENFRIAIVTGSAGVLCSFAAVASKESGIATALLLIVYWFLFRRKEAKLPWFLFLGSAMTVTTVFLLARFLLAPQSQMHMNYLGGSFFQVFLIQPRLWVFMMGKLLWPAHLSADYTLQDMNDPSMPLALAILIVVVLLQVWLACTSRMGALGVAIYWLALVTTSNFIPLYRPLADRFYYLPLAGFAMQLLAFLLMTLKSRLGFWMAVVSCLVALLPLIFMTLKREEVFANEFSLWSDTLQVSPFSAVAHNGLGLVLFQQKQMDAAIVQYQEALKISPNYPEAHNNLGITLFKKGQVDEAISQFQKILEINPNNGQAHNNLGNSLLQKGHFDEAIAQYQKALMVSPHYAEAYTNLGNILCIKGQVDQAIAQYQKALEIDPNNIEAHIDLGSAFSKKGQLDEAFVQYHEVLKIDPYNIEAYNNLGNALSQKGQVDEAITQYQKVLDINPNYAEARSNLGNILFQRGQVDEAIMQYQKALEIDSNNVEVHNNLGNAYSQKGQVDEAIVQYQKALKIDPNNVDILNNLGNAFSQKGRLNEAITQYRKVLKISPNYAEARNNFGLALLQNRQINQAIAQFQEVLRLNPNNSDAQNNLAKANLILQRQIQDKQN